jgi:hypothetical protein
MVLIDLGCRCGLLLLLAGLSRGGAVRLAPVLAVGGLCGALSAASYAGVRALVPRLVRDEHLGRANAVLALGDQLPLLVGTVLVGPALGLLGPGGSVLVPAGMLAAALVVARGLPGRTRERYGPAAGPSSHRVPTAAVAVIALSTTYYLVYGPFETASPAFVREHLRAGQDVYSLLWALFGIGALATVPLGACLARRRPGLVNALGALVWGLVMLPVVALDVVPGVAALFLLGGAVWGPYTTVETTALQRWVDPALHGFVFGVQRSLLASAPPLGAALGALAVPTVGPAVVMGVSAGACALAGLIGLTSRDLRTGR